TARPKRVSDISSAVRLVPTNSEPADLEPKMMDTIESERVNGHGRSSTQTPENDTRQDPPTRSKVGLPTAPPKARNTTWIAAGLVLVVVAGIAASSLWRGLSDRVEVLVAADLIEAGQVITEADLTTASIAADENVRAISPDELSTLIGQVATGPIGAGSIVVPAQFVADVTGDEPTVILGAALQPGQYPIVGLLPGDRVRIIEVSGRDALIGEEAEPQEIAVGEIVEVAGLQQADVYLVSLRINESASLLISERVQQGRISIALLDSGFPDELIDPIGPADPVEPGEPLEQAVPGDDDAATEPDATADPETTDDGGES
ncbi:MAG: SAF domain-containing protein, partial [Ilumatobacter sp.]